MGFLHRTRLWYLLAAAYVAAAVSLVAAPNALDVVLRVALAAASSASVLISDGYHNPDARPPASTDESASADELFWLRWDYNAISAILTTNFWLWAYNLGFAGHLTAGCFLSLAASLAVAAGSVKVVPRRAGHIFVKLSLAFQFVGLLGYLVTQALASPLKWCSLIYFCYLPGFIMYATKWPKNAVWGFHEYFHSSVLLGHLVSMGFDLAILRKIY